MDYYIKKDEDPPYDGIFQKFEDIFCKRMGGGYCCAVSSGSAACYIGIRSLKLPKNSEVIISPVTDSGSLFAITECGLKPVIIDSCKDTYNTSWEEIKTGITKKTSALFLVHCSGNPLNMKKLLESPQNLVSKLLKIVVRHHLQEIVKMEHWLAPLEMCLFIQPCTEKTYRLEDLGELYLQKNIQFIRKLSKSLTGVGQSGVKL